jgi:transposase-like protein
VISRNGVVMPAPRKYPAELRERAVRLVLEAREQDAALSLNAAVQRIAERVGVNPDTLLYAGATNWSHLNTLTPR